MWTFSKYALILRPKNAINLKIKNEEKSKSLYNLIYVYTLDIACFIFMDFFITWIKSTNIREYYRDIVSNHESRRALISRQRGVDRSRALSGIKELGRGTRKREGRRGRRKRGGRSKKNCARCRGNGRSRKTNGRTSRLFLRV